ncbi:MAG: sulfite exporter TauE/SafE family protein [Armatimonadota bacterium]
MNRTREVLGYVTVGLAGGILSGVFGVGSGIVLIPAIVLIWKREQHVAQGTCLLVMIPMAAAACIGYWRNGNVDVGLASALAVGAVVGAFFLGARWAQSIRGSRLRQMFGAFIILVGFRLTGLIPLGGNGLGGDLSAAAAFAMYAIVGLAAGTLSGLFGVGSGILMIPAMVLIWGVEQHIAQGTSLAIMVPMALAGGLRYCEKRQVDGKLAAGLAVAAVIGSLFIGSTLAQQLAAEHLRKLFGVFIILVGLRLTALLDIATGALKGLVVSARVRPETTASGDNPGAEE